MPLQLTPYSPVVSTQFSLSFAQLKAEAQDELGGGSLAGTGRTTTDRIVNRALEYLVNSRPWAWRRTVAALALQAGQGDYPLPADWGRVLAVIGRADPRPWVPADLTDVYRRRAARTDSGPRYWAISAQAQPNVQVAPVRLLCLAPVPTTDLADAASLVYLRQVPQLTDDAAVPAIPAGLASVLCALVRDMARQTEEGQRGISPEVLELLEDAWREDCQAVESDGPLASVENRGNSCVYPGWQPDDRTLAPWE